MDSFILEESDLIYHKQDLKNGETLSYRIFGSGEKWMILINGNLSSFHIWDKVIPFLRKNGDFTFITLEMRGFGRSSYVNPIKSVDDLSQDLILFMDALDIGQAILVGLSLSCLVSIKCAIDNPLRVERLFLSSSISIEGFPPYKKKNPFTGKEERETDLTEIRRKSNRVQKNLLDSNKEYLRMFYQGGMLQNAAALMNNADFEFLLDEALLQKNYVDVITATHFFDIGLNSPQKEIKNLQVPVLIYHGEQDILVNKSVAISNYNQLPSKKSIIIIKKNTGHAIPLENPKDFARTLLNFSNIKIKKNKIAMPKF